MKLELMVEEGTPQEVVGHLTKVIDSNIPPIDDIVVNEYKFKTKRWKIYYDMEDEALSKVPKRLKGKFSNAMKCYQNLRGDERTSLYVPDVDVIFFPPKPAPVWSGWRSQEPTKIYHLGHLIADNTSDADLRLVGVYKKSFIILPNWFQDPLLVYGGNNNFLGGIWLSRYNTGIVELSIEPGQANKQIVLHELGHAFGFDHHRRCVMEDVFTKRYCKNCREKLDALAEAKA